MFKPVGPPTLNCLIPLALLVVLFLALVVAFSSGDLALADTVAMGAGGLGGGGGGGGGGGSGGGGGLPPPHINTVNNSNTLLISFNSYLSFMFNTLIP